MYEITQLPAGCLEKQIFPHCEAMEYHDRCPEFVKALKPPYADSSIFGSV